MRCRISCQSSTSCAPKKLVANTPVRSTMTTVRIAPRPGNVHAEPVLGLQRRRQQQQRLVEHVDHELQHPDGDDQRDPDQQPGNEVFLHGSGNKKARRAPGRVRLLRRSSVRTGRRIWFRSWCRFSFRSWRRVSRRSWCRSSSSGLLLVLGLLLGPPLKSVAYQPPPFSWKPAAVSSFCSAGLPQAGQSVSGGSVTFCRTSCSWPHALQRYS